MPEVAAAPAFKMTDETTSVTTGSIEETIEEAALPNLSTIEVAAAPASELKDTTLVTMGATEDAT